MSFREKSAWISLLANVVIYGAYFVSVAPALMRGDVGRLSMFGMFAESTIAFVVVIVVLTVMTAVLAPKDASAPQDEREKQISLKGSAAAYYVMAPGVVVALAGAFLGFSGVLVANALFLTLVLAETFKDATQIFLYRRGA